MSALVRYGGKTIASTDFLLSW